MHSSSSEKLPGGRRHGKAVRPWAVLVFACGLLFNWAAHAVTVTASPTSCVTSGGSGTGWSNPGRAQTSDNSYATVSLDGSYSEYLECTNYNFNIPAGATINGITVNIERKSSDTANGGSRDSAVYLMSGGTVLTSGANRATTTAYTTSDVTEAHGGATDLWNSTWSAVDINSDNFGVAFSATKPSSTGAAQTVSVDVIQVTVDYTPFACNPPSNTSGVTLTCVCDNFGRASLNPSTIYGANWTLSNSDNIGNPYINATTGLLRLTENTANNAKAATVPGIFPAAGNYISVEFFHYAYNGNGADGIAVTLSDYSIPAVPGGFGGSLGYAQRNDGTQPPGFAGGWVGIALDEYGNYQNPTEGRVLGSGFITQSVGVRGPGSGANGYRWLGGTASNPGGLTIDSAASSTPAPGYLYQVIVDARNYSTGTVNVSVNRDSTTRDGSNYTSLFGPFNAYPEASYALSHGWISKLVPDYWKISFTGSTGGSNNIHEIGGLRICAQTSYPPTGGAASGFSTIDEAYPAAAGSTVPAYQNFQTGHIFMKLAGTPFKLWVAALTTTGLSTAYSASSAKYVAVKLVDNSDNACGTDAARTCNTTCTNKAAVESGATQVATFVNGGTTGVASPSPTFTLNSAWKNLIAVMKECTTSACTAFTSTSPACSADSFSVRPKSVASVISTNATNTTTSGSPTFKAGTDNFDLTATTTGVAGSASLYTGILKINNNALQAVSPATVAGSVTGSFSSATSGTPSSTAIGSTFTYSEVGAFQLAGYDPATDATSPRGVYDGVHTATDCNGLTTVQCDTLKAATWTGIDSVSTEGDCVVDSYSNSKDSNGKYGCNFGNMAAVGPFGRFIPDHFRVDKRTDISSDPDATNRSVRNRADLTGFHTFTYMDEPFQVGFILTAENGANQTTKNYTGALAKLDGSLASVWNWNNFGANSSIGPGAVSGSTPLTARLSTVVGSPSGSFTAGVGSFSANLILTRSTSPDGPFQNSGTDNRVRIGIAPQDSDGVKLASTYLNLDAQGAGAMPGAASVAPNGVAERAELGRLDIRFGRLWLGNAYGSEKRSLSLPYELQYWNGLAFVKNGDDTGTVLTAANFGLGNYQGGITASNLPVTAVTVQAVGPSNPGGGSISLAAPNPSAAGSVDIVARLTGTVNMCPGWTPSYPSGTPFSAAYLQGKWCGTTYAKDPNARATFGIYGSSAKRGPIYIRENF